MGARETGLPRPWTASEQTTAPGDRPSSQARPLLREPPRARPCPSSSHLPALVPEELPGVLDDLLVRQLGIGLLLAEGESLPEGHPEGPHVARRGELALFREEKGDSEQQPAGREL